MEMKQQRLLPFFKDLKQAFSLGAIALAFTFLLLFFSPRSNSTTKLKAPAMPNDRRDDQCELFRGRWVWEKREDYYSNVSCPTLPHTKDCFKYGRQDRDFLNWRWKPDGCDLPRFDSVAFMAMVRGMKIAFVGDSVSRNQADSLLCLLSSVELPEVIHDEKNRQGTWLFKSHNITITMLWTRFLVLANDSSNPGMFDLHIDQVDPKWSRNISGAHIVLVSSGAWFARPNFVYSNNTLLGCYYCSSNNLTIEYVYKHSLRTALNFINQCDECGKVATILRTYSPTHFENGEWNTGGRCRRTRPLASEEEAERAVKYDERMARRYQLEEVERVKKDGKKKKKKVEVMDVSRAMSYRADGHPGEHFYYHSASGWSDCRHWCLPGAIDTWNEMLFAMLKREIV